MKNLNIKKVLNGSYSGNIIIGACIILLIYLLGAAYFANHFFFNTRINGADVSLKAHRQAGAIVSTYIKEYKLQLIERNQETEEIIGQDIDLKSNANSNISSTYHMKSAFWWAGSLFGQQQYYINDLFTYDKAKLEGRIKSLNCLNKPVTEPQNVSFKYLNGYYEAVEEVYGNKIKGNILKSAVEASLLSGGRKLDLNEKKCYENPKFTLESHKTVETLYLLNKYVSSQITYSFGSRSEVLDGNTINQWLSVDDNLEAVISEIEVLKYVRALSKKYDTMGVTRKFKTSPGKTMEVPGGIYGWKIDRDAEAKELLKDIRLGKPMEKEPIYTQKAVSREEDDIGSTYVEVNITRQYLWFYKNGKSIIQGPVVTGDLGKGYSTVTGTFMLNYKQRDATLVGPGYSTLISYWMPFFGNTGIHEASWRYSFGGKIYKNNGSHGCVNTPTYLAKTLYENIEEGTPIIVYEE